MIFLLFQTNFYDFSSVYNSLFSERMVVEVLQLFFFTSFKINVIRLFIKNTSDSEIFENALFPSNVFKKMV